MKSVPWREGRYIEQQFQLLDMQAKQYAVLEAEGIAERARAALRPKRQALIGMLPTRLVVKRSYETLKRSEEVVSRADLCFLSARMHANGTIRTIRSTVHVSEIYQAAQLAAPGFSNEDAKTIEEMVASLEHYRSTGLLPDLNDWCTGISYAAPRPGIQMPPVPEL